MSEHNRNYEMNRLHEKVLYVVANDDRKDAVITILFVGWIVFGLVIIFLELMYGGSAAMMALLTAGVAGGILWLTNTWWKHRLHAKYSPDNTVQGQLHSRP